MKEKFWQSHPYLFQLILSFGIGLIVGIIELIVEYFKYGIVYTGISFMSSLMLFGFILGAFIIYPVILTIYQIILLVKVTKQDKIKILDRSARLFDLWTLFLAITYQLLYLSFREVDFFADWDMVLMNYSKHTPIFTAAHGPTIVLLLLSLMGFMVLYNKSVNDLPPLFSVLCVSAIYIGIIWTVIWTIQIVKLDDLMNLLLILPGIVVTTMGTRIIILKVKEYAPEAGRMTKIDGSPMLRKFNQILNNSRNWPVLAFLFMIPILGIFVMILVLFGQSPDILIKAFTETSEWNLSEKISPQNIYQDEHYLCTVAAGGHKRLVRPIRKGIRHGNPVVINRQLLIANAFEQILEEKTPRGHYHIRKIYDTYGFPIAKLIRSKWIADFIWLLMKPLEWIFLIGIYLFDQYPEDRIAIQYTDNRGRILLSSYRKYGIR